jgi:membrane AbrB-like protein
MNKLGGMALALGIGACGGWLFYTLNMPLPWMLGSMLFVAIAAIAKQPVRLALPLRNTMVTVLGALLGSSFTPDILDRAHHWLGGVVLMISFVAVMTAISVNLFMRFGGFDRVTAYFSGTPGGLAFMTILGEQQGGDPKIIPLVHATRIFFVVFAIPMYLLLVEGLDVPRGANAIPAGPLATPQELLILALCAGSGLLLAKALRLPGAQIVGPMIVSAAAYLSGIVHAPPPPSLVSAAQVVIGAGIGVRFAGLDIRKMAWPLLYALLSGALMLAGAAVLANVVAPYMGLSSYALLLALAPGGLAEMSLIALSLKVDTAFIATMHIVRIMLVVTFAPIAFRLMGWSKADEPAAD